MSGFVNPPIGEALAFDALHRAFSAHGIVHAQLDPMILAEIALSKVASQSPHHHLSLYNPKSSGRRASRGL
jgi:hypothetical protein